MDRKPLGVRGSLIWSGIPVLALFLGTRFLIPALVSRGLHGLYAWYICGTLVMGGMLLTAFLQFPSGRRREFFRLGSLSKSNRKKTLLFTITALLSMGVIYFTLEKLAGPSSKMPYFLAGTVIEGQNRFLLFLLWLPMFFCNIVGEELYWRGYLLPRQEKALGKRAWLFNGLFWILFHIPFGWRTIIMVMPVFFLLPKLAQRTGNTWPGIVMHALVNGPAFAAILLGLI